MMRFEAVNNVIILLKDHGDIKSTSGLILPESQQNDGVPAPYTGTIDSAGVECEWKKGDRIAFCDMGGVYMQVDDREYVVILPEMVVGKLEE